MSTEENIQLTETNTPSSDEFIGHQQEEQQEQVGQQHTVDHHEVLHANDDSVTNDQDLESAATEEQEQDADDAGQTEVEQGADGGRQLDEAE